MTALAVTKGRYWFVPVKCTVLKAYRIWLNFIVALYILSAFTYNAKLTSVIKHIPSVNQSISILCKIKMMKLTELTSFNLSYEQTSFLLSSQITINQLETVAT